MREQEAVDAGYSRHYPRAITKGGQAIVVKTPFEHAEMIEKGWSGPAIFETDIEDMKELITQTEQDLKQMKAELEKMEKAAGVKKSKPEFKCPVCDKVFPNEQALHGHIANHK